MIKKNKNTKKRVIVGKKYDLKDLIEGIKKINDPQPHLNVVKWMAKNGR
jgi:hypothetical protein